jgi:hypothetical protein
MPCLKRPHLDPTSWPPQVAIVVRRILFSFGLEGWQMGKTRVFLRAGQLALLEVGSDKQLGM